MRRRRSSLAIVSAWPPPYGGVSVEVLRLRPLLDRRGVDFVIYNAVSSSGDGCRVIPVGRWRRLWTPLFLLTGREPAIYLMSERVIVWILGALASRWRGKRVLVQLRSAALLDKILPRALPRGCARFALRHLTGVVCVNRALVEAVRTLGVEPSRIHYSPAFLPPADPRQERAMVAPAVWTFVGAHRPIIAANGRVEWYRGQDLYGFDLLVELAARLKPDYPGLGIVVCLWEHGPHEDSYLQDLRRHAARSGVADHILFNPERGVFVPVLDAADVFVRPTNTDGDAVSVREALALGVPAVASDVVERPAGARLFRNRDLDDLEAKVRRALRDAAASPRSTEIQVSPADRRRIEAYIDLLAGLASPSRVPEAASA
jgi:glycosyltransferase involved in cell wall biosynthesis